MARLKVRGERPGKRPQKKCMLFVYSKGHCKKFAPFHNRRRKLENKNKYGDTG